MKELNLIKRIGELKRLRAEIKDIPLEIQTEEERDWRKYLLTPPKKITFNF
jgi:hypothetical protein